MNELQVKAMSITDIESWLEKRINKLLEQDEYTSIDKDKNIFALGMDSVTAIQLQCAAEDEFPGVELGYESFVDEPTIHKIASHIHKHVHATV